MTWKRWLPHAITLLLAALLVLTQQIWAGPVAERLTSTTTGSSKTTINYQGYLTDSSGNPVSDPLDIVFRLYNVESGGEASWTETQGAVAVSDGLFSVLLGSVSPISTEIIANNSDLWLGIAVGGDEEMSPREKIASAPYALLANVPDGSITSAKLADNAVTSAQIQDEQVSNADLASNAVTSGKIQDGQVGNADLADNAVNSAKIQDGQISSSDVGFNYAGSLSKSGPASDVDCSNCISSSEIQDGAVTQTDAPSLVQSAIGNGRRIWSGTVTAVADGNGWVVQSFSHNLSRVDGGAITPHWHSGVWYTAKPPTFGSSYGSIIVGGGLTSGETYTFSVILIGE